MNKSRNYSLDILKFFSTTIILFHHYQQVTQTQIEGFIDFYEGNFYWGYIVELFFILSGYVTYKYVNDINETSSFWLFIQKKYLRFLPLIVLTGIISLGITGVDIMVNDGSSLPYTIWTIVASLLGICHWFSMDLMVNNPVWYISVLFLCYIMFFLLTYWAKRIKIDPFILYAVFVALACCMRSLCITYDVSVPFFSINISRGYLCFFEGLLLYKIVKKHDLANSKLCVCVSLLWLIAYTWLFTNRKYLFGDDLYYILCFTVYPAIILIFNYKSIQNLFSWHFLEKLGPITYNAFMWHLPIIQALSLITSITVIPLQGLPLMILTCIVTYLVGLFSFYFIETPLSKKIKSFI